MMHRHRWEKLEGSTVWRCIVCDLRRSAVIWYQSNLLRIMRWQYSDSWRKRAEPCGNG